MSKINTNKIFFPVWMKVFKVLGNVDTPHTIKSLINKVGSYRFVYGLLVELERRGFIVMARKNTGKRGENNEINIYLTSRGKMLWKTFIEMEIIMGEIIEGKDGIKNR